MLSSSFTRLSTLGLLLLSLSFGSAAQRARVAIANFGWDAVHADWYSYYGSEPAIGRTIRTRLTTRLVQGGRVTLVERQELQTLVDEQNKNMSDRFKAGQGPRGARLSGADYYILGSITVFGRDDRHSSTGGIAAAAGRRLGSGLSVDESRMVVAIDYRLVNSETGEVVDADEARGESKRTSTNLGGRIGDIFGGGSSQKSTNFSRALVDEAVLNCTEALAARINGKISGTTAERPPVELSAKVARVNGSTLFINAGSSRGAQVGMSLMVESAGVPITDPDTQAVIGYDSQPIGTLVLSSVTESLSSGTFTPSIKGAGPKVGDLVRTR